MGLSPLDALLVVLAVWCTIVLYLFLLFFASDWRSIWGLEMMKGTLASNRSLHIHTSAKCAIPVTPILRMSQSLHD